MIVDDDSPLNEKNEDNLNRTVFSEKIADFLYSYARSRSKKNSFQNGLCVGLKGAWGTGKTSVINFIYNELDSKSENKDKYIVLKFNPWLFSSIERIIYEYFKTISCGLASFKDKVSQTLSEMVLDFGKDLLEIIPSDISLETKISKIVLKQATKEVSRLISKFSLLANKPLSEKKKFLDRELIRKNKIIIIFIDDLDRLTNVEIYALIKLITVVADLPNVVNFIAYDENVVANAISKINDSDGHKFLEKIININIELPKISNIDLEKNFDLMVDSFATSNDLASQVSVLKKAFFDFIQPHIYTIRELKHIFNNFKVKFLFLESDCFLYDLLAISAIEEKFPKLYEVIKMNKFLLCSDKFSSINKINEKKVDQYIKSDFSFESDDNEYMLYIKIIHILFFSENYYLSRYFLLSIRNNSSFDRYFYYSLRPEELSYVDFLIFKTSNDIKNNVNKLIKWGKEHNKIKYLLSLINKDFYNSDQSANSEIIIECFLEFLNDCVNSSLYKDIPDINDGETLELMSSVMQHYFSYIEKNDRESFLNKILNKQQNYFNLYVINLFSLSIDKPNDIFLCIKRIITESFKSDPNVLYDIYAYYAILLYEEKDSASCINYLNNFMVNNPNYIPRFISLFVNKITSYTQFVYICNENYFSFIFKILSVEQIQESINNVVKNYDDKIDLIINNEEHCKLIAMLLIRFDSNSVREKGVTLNDVLKKAKRLLFQSNYPLR